MEPIGVRSAASQGQLSMSTPETSELMQEIANVLRRALELVVDLDARLDTKQPPSPSDVEELVEATRALIRTSEWCSPSVHTDHRLQRERARTAIAFVVATRSAAAPCQCGPCVEARSCGVEMGAWT